MRDSIIRAGKTAYRVLLVFLLGFLLPGAEAEAAQRLQDTGESIVIVIDPGHGGENEGTIENGFQEKSMTMRTAQILYDTLSRYDNCTVYMTRTSDVDLTLKERAEFAKSVEADFLFSIHYNASLKHNLFGSEVWISAQPPFNAWGYQFGACQMETMEDMGLFLRGVKTRLNSKGTDYYGIIREAAALDIPAVIIEHCHVDEERDVPYCDTPERQEAFGAADAESIARYFGLYSQSLGVDYRDESGLPEVRADIPVERTLKDETPPEVCMIEAHETDYETGRITVGVTAADYDSMLIYYDYSIDGGVTYSPLLPWPESNALTGEYADTFSMDIEVPSGIIPNIRFRAYNLFDGFQESNELNSFRLFTYGEASKPAPAETADSLEGENTAQESAGGWLTDGGQKASKETGERKEISLMTFLQICLICVAVIFVLAVSAQWINYRKRRRRRRQNSSPSAQRKKDTGDKKNHTR